MHLLQLNASESNALQSGLYDRKENKVLDFKAGSFNEFHLSLWGFTTVTLSVGGTMELRIKRIVFIIFQNKGVIHKETAETHEQDDRDPTNIDWTDRGLNAQNNEGLITRHT